MGVAAARLSKTIENGVLIFLEDRRLLTVQHRREDEDHTRESANQIRHWLTPEIMNVKGGGDLEAAFKRIRAACTAFVSAAGSDSKNFRNDPQLYEACLQSLRDVIGEELGWLSIDYDLPLSPEMQAIVPPPDPRPFV